MRINTANAVHLGSQGSFNQKDFVAKVSKAEVDIPVWKHFWISLLIFIGINLIGASIADKQKIPIKQHRTRETTSQIAAFSWCWFAFKYMKRHWYKSRMQGLVDKIEGGQHKEVQKRIAAIGVPKNQYDTLVVLGAYVGFIPEMLKDFKISEKEKDLMGEFKKSLSDQQRRDTNAAFYTEIVSKVLADRELTAAEDEFLHKATEILELRPEDTAEAAKAIAYYRDLNNLRNLELAKIQPSVNLDEDCFLEVEGKLLKYKSVGSFSQERVRYTKKAYVTEGEGKLYLTDSKIYFVGQGTQIFQIAKIASVEVDTEDEVIEVIFLNKKTPLHLSTPENKKVIIVLNKLMEKLV